MVPRATQVLLLLSIVAVVSLVARLGAAEGPPPAERTSSFLPGHEDEILGLLRPADVESFRCAGWRVEDVRVGPECAVRLDLRHEGSPETTTIALVPRGADERPGSASIAIAVEADTGSPPQRDELLRCLSDALARNDPGDFFTGKCRQRLNEAAVAGGPSAAPSALSLDPLGVLRPLAFLAAVVFALLLLRRRGDRRPEGGTVAPPARVSHRGETWLLAALIAVALLLRARLLAILAPGPFETDGFGDGIPFDNFLRQTCLLPGAWSCDAARFFHPPLVPTALDVWIALGNVFGVGAELVWLRLPNLVLHGWLLWLLVQMGRRVGARAAGWGAALLAAFLPEMVAASVFQGPYFAEMVLTLWFLERLATYVLVRVEVHRSLILAAAAAAWTGHMSLLILGPGVLLYFATAARRGGRRVGLASLLLFAGLYGPIAESTIHTVVQYASISVDSRPDRAATNVLEAIHDHELLVKAPATGATSGAAVSLPLRASGRLLGPTAAWVGLVGVFALLVRRPRDAWFPLLLVATHTAGVAMVSTRWINLTVLFPILLFVPLWGFASLPRRLARWRGGPLPAAACGVLVAVALTEAGAQAYGRVEVDGVSALARWMAGGEDVIELFAHLRAPEQQPMPVLLLTTQAYDYLLCAESDDLSAFYACRKEAIETPWEPDTGGRELNYRGRAVAQLSSALSRRDAVRAACTGLDFLNTREPWSRMPFFVILDREFEDTVAPQCPGTLAGAGCQLERAAPDVHLFLCPPRD